MGPRGPGDVNVDGDWEGPIELFEFEFVDEGWVRCTPGYYWHPVLGGIYQHENKWYMNWEFDYEPPEEEIIPEEPENIEQENPEIPQGSSKEGTPEEQTQIVGENPLTTPQQTSARQSKPPPKPPRPPTHPKPRGDPDPSISTRTRTIDQNYSPLAPLTLEEAKTRENNIAHMKHLREAMKNGIEKWNVAMQKEKDWAEKVCMKSDKEQLERWLEDLDMVLKATDMSPVYIQTVKEEWVRAVQLKPPTPQEDPENLPKQPNKSTGPKPARKHVALKSGAGRQKSDDKNKDTDDNSNQGLNVPPQTESLEEQPGDLIEEPGDGSQPPGTDPKNTQPFSTEPMDPLPPKPKPKNSVGKLKRPEPKNAAGVTPKGTKPDESVPKNTMGTTPGSQTTWYKSEEAYDLKRTGPAAVPSANLLDMTRKRKVGCQPRPSTSGGPTANKRKQTTPAHWLPQTQPRTTYMMGNKITPAWGSIQKGWIQQKTGGFPSTNLLNLQKNKNQHDKQPKRRS